MMQDKAIISFEIQGISEEKTHKYREMIHILISTGSLDVANGKVILNFNNEGDLCDIEAQVKKYRKKRIDL